MYNLIILDDVFSHRYFKEVTPNERISKYKIFQIMPRLFVYYLLV